MRWYIFHLHCVVCVFSVFTRDGGITTLLVDNLILFSFTFCVAYAEPLLFVLLQSEKNLQTNNSIFTVKWRGCEHHVGVKQSYTDWEIYQIWNWEKTMVLEVLWKDGEFWIKRFTHKHVMNALAERKHDFPCGKSELWVGADL